LPDILIADHEALASSSVPVIDDIRRRFSREIPVVAYCFSSHRTLPSLTTPARFSLLVRPLKHSLLLRAVSDLLSGKLPENSRKLEPPAPVALSDLRILVAEDHPVNQKLILRILKKLGYEADLAANGLQVMEAVYEKTYHLIFMDIQMPEMDGIEATVRIRKELPAGRQPKIVALTAHASQENRSRCLEAGMTEFLTKPILVDEVRDTIARLFGGSTERSKETQTTPLEDSDLRARLQEFGGATEAVFLRELVQAFLHEVPNQLELIDRALAQVDIKSLREEAHALKGSSINIGASRMANLAKALEDHGKQGLPIGPDLTTSALRAEFEHVQQQLLSYVRSLS
jgi:CheY-like chemotaxis protein